MSVEQQIANLYPELKSWSFRFYNSEDDRNDLIQDTFFNALNNLDKFKEGTNLKGFLYTVMRNIFINNCRKNQTTSIYCQNDLSIFHVTSNDSSDYQVELDTFKELFRTLPDDFRDCLSLHADGYKYEEISEIMNCPIGTVKSKIFIGRNKLLKLLNDGKSKFKTIST